MAKAKVSETEAKLGMVKVVAPIVWEVRATFTSCPLVRSSGVAAEVASEVAEATPKTGVTKVGEVFITKVVPVPVCKAIDVALPTEVIGPVRLALVVTVPAVNPVAVPVRLVATPETGVPKAGATKVLLLKV